MIKSKNVIVGSALKIKVFFSIKRYKIVTSAALFTNVIFHKLTSANMDEHYIEQGGPTFMNQENRKISYQKISKRIVGDRV